MRMPTKCGRNWSMVIDLSVTKPCNIRASVPLYRDGMGEISRDPRTKCCIQSLIPSLSCSRNLERERRRVVLALETLPAHVGRTEA